MLISKLAKIVVLAAAAVVGCTGQDGVPGQSYEPGSGLELSGTTLSVSQTQVESWAKGVCYDNPEELSAFAQAEHDHDALYEPKLGRVLVVHAVPGDSSASGTALLEAVSGITDAAIDASVLVLLEPGTYDLGGNSLSLPEYVDLAGLTKINTEVTSDSPSGTIVVTASDAPVALHDLTIGNRGDSARAFSVGLVLDGTVAADLRSLRVIAENGTSSTYGIWARGSARFLTVNDLSVSAISEAGTAVGILCDNCAGSSRVSKGFIMAGATADGVVVEGIEVSTNTTSGLSLVDFDIMTATALVAPASITGIRVAAGVVDLVSSRVNVFEGTAVSVSGTGNIAIRAGELQGKIGVSATGGGSALVHSSQITSFNTAVLVDADSTAKLASTELTGAVSGAGVTCYAVTRDFANTNSVNSCP